jgi:hypothetical protein
LTPYVACKELYDILKPHRDTLQKSLDDLRLESTRESTNLQDAEANRRELQAKRETQLTSAAQLDLPHLEIIPDDKIQGRTSFSESKSIFLRPKFKFSLTAQYPIKSWRKYQSDNVKWDFISCPEGGKVLNTTARAKSTAAANASIELYGWKKEIHAAEIEMLRTSIIDLDKEISAAMETEKQLLKKCCAILEQLEQATREMERCNRAIETVMTSQHNVTLGSHGENYLTAGSISGYASYALCLDVQVHPALSSTSDVDAAALESVIDTCHKDLLSAKASMSRYQLNHTWAAEGDGVRELTSITTSLNRAGSSPSYDVNLVRLALRKLVLQDDELAKLAAECREDVDRISADVQATRDELLAELGQLPSSEVFSSAKRAEVASARMKVDGMADAMEDACLLVKAKPQSVGVAAAMQSKRYAGPAGSIDTFFSVYEGERIRAGV